MSDCKISVEQIDLKGISSFVRLSGVEYDQNSPVTNLDQMKWKHLNTVYGASTAINLRSERDLVGRVLLQPRILYVDGEKISVAFATDSLVHQDFRRPFSNFFSIINEIAKVNDFSLVLHTSNENTEGIYHNILKLKCPISLSGYGLPVSLSKITEKILGFNALIFQSINIPYRFILNMLHGLMSFYSKLIILPDIAGSQVNVDFFSDEDVLNNFELVRDEKYIKWRYKETPLCKADVFHLYRNGDYIGYMVLRNIELENLKFTALMDFSLSKISVIDMMYIRMYIIKKAMERKNDAVFMLFNKEAIEAKKFLGFPFFLIPDKYLPHKTPLFAHLNNPQKVSADKLSGLHVTLGDLDYF